MPKVETKIFFFKYRFFHTFFEAGNSEKMYVYRIVGYPADGMRIANIFVLIQINFYPILN